MESKQAANILLKTLKPFGLLTISDAATQSGLALRDAERGLHQLISDYRGVLSVTEQGDILFRFPYGFRKPWEKTEALVAFWNKTKRVVKGVAKFIVRAWISVVMVAYVAIFAAILIALSFKSSDDKEERSSFGSSLLLHSLIRLVLDSLFWTFHPFSPFYIGYTRPLPGTQGPQIPFYERVNRFFFGPEEPPVDPLRTKQKILAEIRANSGRIGIANVMRVTGLSRAQVDPMMAQLMLDYEGQVLVSEQGGIVYVFSDLRKTASASQDIQPKPIWMEKKRLLPLTGNPVSSNLLIGGLNGFNLWMSIVAIQNGWTLEKLGFLLSPKAHQLSAIPPEGVPLLLGWIPFWFSTALFGLVIVRLLQRSAQRKKVGRENGRRGLLHIVLSQLSKYGIPESKLMHGWQQASGEKPSEKEFIREIVKLGGEPDVSEQGALKYRFKELEADWQAVSEAQGKASAQEKNTGSVVYTS